MIIKCYTLRFLVCLAVLVLLFSCNVDDTNPNNEIKNTQDNRIIENVNEYVAFVFQFLKEKASKDTVYKGMKNQYDQLLEVNNEFIFTKHRNESKNKTVFTFDLENELVGVWYNAEFSEMKEVYNFFNELYDDLQNEHIKHLEKEIKRSDIQQVNWNIPFNDSNYINMILRVADLNVIFTAYLMEYNPVNFHLPNEYGLVFHEEWEAFKEVILTNDLTFDWQAFVEIEGQDGRDYTYLFGDEYVKYELIRMDYDDLDRIIFEGEQARRLRVRKETDDYFEISDFIFYESENKGLRLIGFEMFTEY